MHKITHRKRQEGQSKHPLYKTHENILQRCNNVAHRDYKNWGGRGIKVCNKWQGRDGFFNFVKDMGDKPTSKHTVDRIDNDKGYSPENCRWATRREQTLNSRIRRTNTSGVKGISWHKQTGKWRPRLTVNYKSISIGLFDSLEEAKEARERAELNYV